MVCRRTTHPPCLSPRAIIRYNNIFIQLFVYFLSLVFWFVHCVIELCVAKSLNVFSVVVLNVNASGTLRSSIYFSLCSVKFSGLLLLVQSVFLLNYCIYD